MSLPGGDTDQLWTPTHVQVTVHTGRGLRAKGKHGTSDVYTVIQLGREKFSTAVVEKSISPQWNEECAFELAPGALEAPTGSNSELILTVMHRALIGLDQFLGQAIIHLEKIFTGGTCPRNEWFKLHSKSGKKEKERGELQVTIQFTRNNLTASMYDLSIKDKPRSTLSKLKDRVRGKKRGDIESASAILPGGYGALSGRIAREEEAEEEGVPRKGKVKDFFLRGRLRKTSDTRSNTSLTSESSALSSPGGSLSPTAGISMVVSDISNSPSNSSNLTAENSPTTTRAPSPLPMTHKRAFSDEASKITTFLPWPRAVENLKAQNRAVSQSSLCINGVHVYTNEPMVPRSATTLPRRLGLLDKCSPLSRSLQNLTRRGDDLTKATSGGRRWSFDRSSKEEKVPLPAAVVQSDTSPTEVQLPLASVTPIEIPEAPLSEVKKPKKNLFSHCRSDSAGKVLDAAKGPSSEERQRSWFGSKDPQNKPSPEVSPKVETISDAPSHLSSQSSSHCSPSLPLAFNKPFPPPSATPPMSPSNPFFSRLQCNPFYEELIAHQSLTSSLHGSQPASSPLQPSSVSPSWPDNPNQPNLQTPNDSPKRERPVGVSRQRSLPEMLPPIPSSVVKRSPNPFVSRSMSESGGEWDDSFEAFATGRLKSPKRPTTLSPLKTDNPYVDRSAAHMDGAGVKFGKPPPLPPRRSERTPIKNLTNDSWLNQTQVLAVKKEASLLFQTHTASLRNRRRENLSRNEDDCSLVESSPFRYIPECTPTSNSPPSYLCARENNILEASNAHDNANNETTGHKTISRTIVLCEPFSNGPEAAIKDSDNDGISTSLIDVTEPKVDALPCIIPETSPVLGTSSPSPIIKETKNEDMVITADETLNISKIATVQPTNISQDSLELPCIAHARPPSQVFLNPSEDKNTSIDIGFSNSLIFPGRSNETHCDKPNTLSTETFSSLSAHSDPICQDQCIPTEESNFSYLLDANGCLTHSLPPTVLKDKGPDYLSPSNHNGNLRSETPEKQPKRPSATVSPLSLNDKHGQCHFTFDIPFSSIPPRDLTLTSEQSGNKSKECFQNEDSRLQINQPETSATKPLHSSLSNRSSILPLHVDTMLESYSSSTNTSLPVSLPSTESMHAKTCGSFNIPLLDGCISNETPGGDVIQDLYKGLSTFGVNHSPDRGNKQETLSVSTQNLDLGIDKDLKTTKQNLSLLPSVEQQKEATTSSQPYNACPSFFAFCQDVDVNVNSNTLSQEEPLTKESTHKTSFECLHAKVAPDLKSHSLVGLPMHACAPQTLSTATMANTNRQLALPTSPISPPLTEKPSAGTTQAAAPTYTVQPLIGAAHTVLPEETQPASSFLSHQENSPHPVKPLTATVLQGEKKADGRSVLASGLEKLKATIHPGKSMQQSESEAGKNKVEGSTRYQHMSHSELVVLLQQKEEELEKQKAELEKQGALLEKRDVELRKMKMQVRDLEDYIDRLLVRIMEQKPTLLQVRTKP